MQLDKTVVDAIKKSCNDQNLDDQFSVALIKLIERYISNQLSKQQLAENINRIYNLMA